MISWWVRIGCHKILVYQIWTNIVISFFDGSIEPRSHVSAVWKRANPFRVVQTLDSIWIQYQFIWMKRYTPSRLAEVNPDRSNTTHRRFFTPQDTKPPFVPKSSISFLKKKKKNPVHYYRLRVPFPLPTSLFSYDLPQGLVLVFPTSSCAVNYWSTGQQTIRSKVIPILTRFTLIALHKK